MISQKEIISISEEIGISVEIIDRDWAQGHIIKYIYLHPTLKDILIFKGAGSLRKCWYTNYRFTEDLDFSSVSDSFELKSEHLDFICDELKKNIGICSYYESILPMVYNNKTVGYEVKIYFWGANHKNNPSTRDAKFQSHINIEISINECGGGKTILKPILHPYSDNNLLNDIHVISLDLHELIAEKLRTILTRPFSSPKDYYDVWRLIKTSNDLNKSTFKKIFMKKMECKNLECKEVIQILNNDKAEKLVASWNATLVKLIPRNDVPDFELVKLGLNEYFLNF